MSSEIFYQHMLEMVHSQHRMHGNVYLRVNSTKVQFSLGTVEHLHTTSIGLEQYILYIHHTGHGILSKERRTLLLPSISFLQMISQLAEMPMDSKFCMYCNVHYNNIVDHCINTCAFLEIERANLWLEILEISIQAYIFLCNTDGSRVTDGLLGMEIAEFARILVIKVSSLRYAALLTSTKCGVSIRI